MCECTRGYVGDRKKAGGCRVARCTMLSYRVPCRAPGINQVGRPNRPWGEEKKREGIEIEKGGSANALSDWDSIKPLLCAVCVVPALALSQAATAAAAAAAAEMCRERRGVVSF